MALDADETMDDGELASLTPAERAALEFDVDEDVVASNEDDEDDDAAAAAAAEEDDEEDEEAAAAAAADDDAGAAAEGDDEGGADTPPVETGALPGDTPIATVTPPDTEKLEQELSEAEAELEKLGQRFADGELTDAEYHKQSTQLTRAVMRAENRIDRAKEAGERQQADAKDSWDRAVSNFLADEQNKVFSKGALFDALDAEVVRIQQEGKQQFESAEALFRAARTNVVANFAEMGVAIPGFETDAGDEAPAGDEEGGKKRPPKTSAPPKVPTTLGSMPAAAANRTESKHAELEALISGNNNETNFELEKRLASMSPQEAQEWLEGTS